MEATAVSPARGVSIRLYLVDGSPAGLWVVEKSNWTGIALMWPRAIHADAHLRPELERPGVYVLVGPSEVSAKRRIYIGEADVLRKRLDQHHASKDFWIRAIAFTTKDASLNKAHAKYIESRLIELALEARRDEVENGNAPRRPALAEAETADVEAFLDEMLVIYPVLDVRTFERAEAPRGGHVLRLHGPEAEGEGEETPDGFLVRTGSRARSTAAPSTHGWVIDIRTQLVESGVFVPDGAGLRLTEDHLFSSPSSAAAVLLGRNANGRTEWKDADGRTLRQLQSAVASA
jgi:hypothetical protein